MGQAHPDHGERIMTETATTRVRALDLLVKDFAPILRRREPFWRPMVAKCETDVYEPAWSWRDRWVADENVVVLDLVAAYLSAASTVQVAHGKLMPSGPLMFDRKRAGYWRIKIYPWCVPGIVSPLGTATLDQDAWLTTQTVSVLDDLAAEGYWPGIDVLDSWTCPDTVRVRKWAEHLASLRREAIYTHDTAAYDDLKVAYSQAVTLMGVDKRSRLYRPDWGRAIRTQHAANTWRKAWGAYLMGHGPVAAGTVDELAFRHSSIEWFTGRRLAGDRVPVKVDPTGTQLGSFRVKATHTPEQWNRR